MMIHGQQQPAGINEMSIHGDNLDAIVNFQGDMIRLSDHVGGTVKVHMDAISELLAIMEVALRFRHLETIPESDNDDMEDDNL